MSIERDNFGYLDKTFQYRLLNHILHDNQFADSILEILDPNYFDEENLRMVGVVLKDAYDKDESIPDIASLTARMLDKATDDHKREIVYATLRRVEEANKNDAIWIKETAIKFCKQQELKKAIKAAEVILERGSLDDYSKIEDVIRSAMEKGDNRDNALHICDNIDDILADDFRDPIPTGIPGLDDLMKGGLAKKELGVILAAFGIGKTTALTKIANTARNLGKNVLQIIFEDQPKVIQRKHLACWTKINPDDFAVNKERIKEIAKEMDAMPGGLVIKKFTSGATTIPMIRQYIRRLIARGFKPDVVTLDYIDCVIPSTHESDVNVGEGKVMRQFEALADEFDVAAWTAIQGNRSSIKSEIVESDQMGGSIKRGQIGHFIMSFAKSLDQKVSNRANIAILKSRFSKDGFIITDVVFDNGTLEINMTDESTISTQVAYGQMKQEQKQNKVTSIFEAAQKRMLDKNKNDLNELI